MTSSLRVAVIGAGMAGASCAWSLAQAGCAVCVVDKSRGAGGRMATRRLEWLDQQGLGRIAKLDHGAPALTAPSPAFRQFLETALPAGALASWRPRLAAGGRPWLETEPWWLPKADMPSLCRILLQDVPATWSFAVDRLQSGPLGWRLEAAGSVLPGQFDVVLLAMPPAQAASLLAPHRSDWAQSAALALMQPCWTLMGVARRPRKTLDWDIGRPAQGPLDWVMRHDTRPGRECPADEVQWIAHAHAGWSRHYVERSADEVQVALKAALQDWLGEPVEWHHAAVHRWLYAMPESPARVPAPPCWWDVTRGLGVCGDFLGGGGVEGAWQSGQALSQAILSSDATVSPPP